MRSASAWPAGRTAGKWRGGTLDPTSGRAKGGDGTVALTHEHVERWRLGQHHLLERLPRRRMIDAVADVGGIQAQMASAAELSIAARVDGVHPVHVREALWKQRTLVRTWAHRGTLHLLPAHEYGSWTAALGTRDHWRKGVYLRQWGVTAEELEAGIAAIGAAMGGEPMTRDEIIEALRGRLAPALHARLASGWGELLKPASYLGLLCAGPARGRNVTFVRPSQWLGRWEPVSPHEAMRELARRWLHAYGPGTHPEFAAWFGRAVGPIGRTFRSLGDELERVDVEGRVAWALGSDVDEIRATEPSSGVVRLLPHFDVYTLGFRPRERFVVGADLGRVFRQAGWISPVVLLDGRAAGVWSYERSDAAIVVTVELFRRRTRALREGVEREAARLGDVLGAEGRLRFAATS